MFVIIGHDPLISNFISLYIAIKNYTELTPEQAFKGKLRRGIKPTPELKNRIYKIISSPNFKDFKNIEKIYKINRYDFHEGGVEVAQTESELKKLMAFTQVCNAKADYCDKCELYKIFYGDRTFCEVLLNDFEIDEGGKLIALENQQVQKSAKKCNLIKCEGTTGKRGFEIYKNVLDALGGYLNNHKEKKVKDIVSAALVEYMGRHK